METKAKPGTAAIKKFEENTVEQVLVKINSLREVGGLALPKDYSAENALRSAWLILTDLKAADKTPVLKSCTRDSIANSLFKMVSEGLNPSKHQCGFVPYGNKLTCQREYAGSIALAQRYHPGLKDPVPGIIYEKDVFQYAIDPKTGRKVLIKHEQALENINFSKIKGAYATISYEGDDYSYIELMTMDQIRKSWEQGPTKGKSPAHINFPDQMCGKTVINRACKILIAASDDSVLMEPETDSRKLKAKAAVEQEANKGTVIDIPVDEEPIQEAEVVEIVEPSDELTGSPPPPPDREVKRGPGRPAAIKPAQPQPEDEHTDPPPF